MKADPRRALEEAAQERLDCELFVRGGGVVQGTFSRVERGGVVVTVRGGAVPAGSDVRVWYAAGGRACSFVASVLRTGVPVPDRSQNGLLLGFIDQWRDRPVTGERGRELALVPPSGPPISLLDPPVRLLQLGLDGLSFTVPADYTLVFVEQAGFELRLSAAGHEPARVHGIVRTLVREAGHMLYEVRFADADDPERLRRVVDLLAP